ncbi:MAG: hypothetical protein H7Y42_06780 [Chitinophagaceae bacterium]|nr:hypothetical protein [Chitinophagaceae bacterium]
MERLNHYVKAIASIFKDEKDRYEAHRKAAPVLKEMGADKEVLFDVFRKNLSDPNFINKPRHYPTIAFEIFQDENVGISGNCFMPLPDRSTDLSFQSIHHHGKLLLTTVAAFGPGYESIVFKKGYAINKQEQTANMEIEKQYQFGPGNLEFVDSDQPHVVFFPKEASITFAMWAYARTNATTQTLKNNVLIKKFKEPIRKALKALGLLDKAGVNLVENFDFYPEKKQIRVLKNRINFEEGSNENFLTNVFYVLQRAGFNDMTFLQSLKQKFPQHNALHGLIDRFVAGTPIKDEFYDFHKNVKYVNLTKQDILNAFN